MSLWDPPDALDEEGLKAKRRQEKEEFFTEPEETNWEDTGWAQFRHDAHYGMDDPDRQLVPFVDYIPLGLNDDVPVESKKKSVFNKQSAEERDVPKADFDESNDSDEDRPMAIRISSGPKTDDSHSRVSDEDAAAVKIQTHVRARLARKRVKKMVCKVWMKKMDTTPGVYFYQNKITGEKRWVPPHLMRRYFPKLRW